MFKKLRNRLILINVGITTIIIVIAFAAIYVSAYTASNKRPLPPNDAEFNSPHISQMMSERLHDERLRSLESLFWSLLIIGIAIEILVIIASYIFAEIAIRPVRETYESQKQFIANASHEMKTPLAAISANLEAADIKNNQWVDNISLELDSLARLNQDLLALVQAEQLEYSHAPEEIDLKPYLDQLLRRFSPQLKAKKVKLSVEVNPVDAKLTVSRAAFEQLLKILLDNAIKYGEKKVIIKYQNRTLSISNDGMTIPKSAQPHIFERFYQVDKSSEGVGLGLAIAKAIVDHNHWGLTVESESGLTTFSVYP